jgi:two-component system, sporulation sensor kinase E
MNFQSGASLEVELTVPELKKKCFCILNLSVVDTEKNIRQLVLHDITERILNEQKEKILEKQALTGKVARVIAHEIKNPLTNIQLSVSELRSMLPAMTSSLQQDSLDNNDEVGPDEFLDIIECNSKRINTLIEDLLHATRYETIHLTEIYIHDLISEMLTHVQDRMRLKGVGIEKDIQESVLIKGDKEKLVIALLNVMVNAVEAVPEKTGKLALTTTTANNKVSIIITDNGKGIPKKDMDKIFEPFFTSKRGGTGLGLTAAYNIIAKHGGEIRVNSKPGEGTSFVITLATL